MCGITGIFAFNLVGKFNKIQITSATMALEKRGPDFQDIFLDEWVGLGHRRLSVIDTSQHANQPMWDETKRYCIIFNGEIFNYRELRQALESKGASFQSHSDTEVLLQLYIREQATCLHKLNGFFSFCVYDKTEQSFFIARDRYGVKPLLYLFDEDKFIFASEMKSILQYGIEKEIDYTSLHTYLQLNYIPAPHSIFRHVKKLLPGNYIKVGKRRMTINQWYDIPYDKNDAQSNSISYDLAKEKFKTLLDASVQQRLVSDVPLGAFLSGGVDSSVITGLASRHKPDLHTFSIGFRDEKFFDETAYARLVARHFKTDHTEFSLSNNDLFEHVNSILNYIDEPFADSSAINVYILSKQTKRHATVALSGDGADELLGGYNKHAAFYRMIHRGWRENTLTALLPLFKKFPQSRENKMSNLTRQIIRFGEGSRLNEKERYWRWAAYADDGAAKSILTERARENLSEGEFTGRKKDILRHITPGHNINDILITDMKLVLPDDMLTKVDLMSMANGLEVRTPFLDHSLVDFVFSLPDHFKINRSIRKKILQDSYRDMLPAKLYNRPKKGFEVPLLKWFRKEMRTLIFDDLLSEKNISAQGIFNYVEIEKLKRQLMSDNPGDVHARIWALIVFQWWYKKYVGVSK